MKLSLLLTTTVLLVPGAFAAYLPKCSVSSTTPCSCPAGTEYEESVTFSVIGAAATDVAAVISSFFEPGWLGVVPYAHTGVDQKRGATRSSTVPTLIGKYNFTELLDEFKSDLDGSFVQVFEQLPSTVPLPYTTGNGSFSGYWITLGAKHIFQYETAIWWSVYACETGHPRDFAKFHESALSNATSILEKAGKIKGKNVEPFSIQSF